MISPYSDRLEILDMPSLERRRTNSAIMFLYDTINGFVHCPLLKDEIIISSKALNLRDTTMETFKLNN